MIVMKFGGTSVKNAEAMSSAIEIVRTRKKYSPVVVLSACGGITDKLLELINNAPFIQFDESLKSISEIENLHLNIIENLIKNKNLKADATENIKNLCNDLKNLIQGITLLRESTPRRADSVLAFGELLSTSIFEAACRDNKIDSFFLDARKVMKTDNNFNNANVDFELVKKSAEWFILPELTKGKVVVTQGFIGSDLSDTTTTLGRGGSDYSAAVIGSVLNVDEIQIWTDVSGVLSADPRIIPGAKTIPEMTFNEVLELSYYGAKVLHPDTIKPAIENNIPVKVLNTFQPENPGTLILGKSDSNVPSLHSVVMKENCLLCTIDYSNNNNSSDIKNSIVQKLAEQNIIPLFSSEISHRISILLDDNPNANEEFIRNFLSEYKQVLKRLTLICICGNNLDKYENGVNSFIEKIVRTTTSYSPHGIIFGLTPASVLILVPVEKGKSVLEELHKLI
ncbi:MAG: aspartate kinase [FCB group bacterium]|jgi:aspartate kinase